MEAPVWQEPPRGAAADPAVIALPGVERLRTFLDGRSPLPPVARLTGRRLVEAEEGRVVYALPVSRWLVGPKGTLHPGVLAFLADAPLLAAIVSLLPPATPSTTAEVSTTFLGTVGVGDELRAEGRVIHVDSTTGLAEASITSRDGRLIAHATSRGFVLPALDLDGASPELHQVEEPEHATPDPWERPVDGEPPGLRDVGGLELLRQRIDGRLPPPPIDRLTGVRAVAAEEGRATFALTAHPWTTNEFGSVFGGMIALLASSAGSAAVQTDAPPGTPFAALDMKLNLIRPVFPDGSELVATANVIHSGRNLAISSTEIVGGDGRTIAMATGTTMLGEAAAERANEAQRLLA